MRGHSCYGLGMVTAKTQYNLNNAREYFEEHLCVGDYYAEGQRVSGEWFGLGSERLGLSGKIGADEFLRLCDNQHPVTGEILTQRLNTTRVAEGDSTANRRIFYDFTFSPPKSVSIVALADGDERIPKCTGHLVTTNNELVLRRYRHIPPGGNWCDIPLRLMSNYSNLNDDRSRHTGIYRRLVWDEPSVVISNFRKNMLVHPEQNRGLSVREAARLQSFPDHYRFSGSIGFQQQQVGNAVPPLLAKAVFSQLIAYS